MLNADVLYLQKFGYKNLGALLINGRHRAVKETPWDLQEVRISR